uniref:DNA-directed DNA polymerase n=1 Tax=Globodera rostochiensis TaxID=31243 RepID=A0A914HD07_GLORO
MSSSKWNFTSIASNFEADNQDEQGERHEREVQQGSGSQKRQHHPNDDFDPGNDSENNEIDNTDDDQFGFYCEKIFDFYCEIRSNISYSGLALLSNYLDNI